MEFTYEFTNSTWECEPVKMGSQPTEIRFLGIRLPREVEVSPSKDIKSGDLTINNLYIYIYYINNINYNSTTAFLDPLLNVPFFFGGGSTSSYCKRS